jgi:hypothetical protein
VTIITGIERAAHTFNVNKKAIHKPSLVNLKPHHKKFTLYNIVPSIMKALGKAIINENTGMKKRVLNRKFFTERPDKSDIIRDNTIQKRENKTLDNTTKKGDIITNKVFSRSENP